MAGQFLRGLAVIVAFSGPAYGEIATDADAKAALSAAAAMATGAERIRGDVAYLADDQRQGRDTGSEGYLQAAQFVAARMEQIGLKPAGEDGGWFQTVTLQSVSPTASEAAFELRDRRGANELRHGDDFLMGRPTSAAAFDVQGPAVFVGYGVVDAASGLDDYAGLDVNGAVVVMFAGAPATLDSEKRAHHARFDVKSAAAAARGAVGVVSLPNSVKFNADDWARTAGFTSRPAMSIVHPDGALIPPTISATALVNAKTAKRLFAGAPESFKSVVSAKESPTGAVKGFALGRSIRLKGAASATTISSVNVVGMLHGSDAERADEVVLLSAHLDHLGVRPGADGAGDTINNGALDNAIGVASMLEAASILAKGERPARSVAFIALTAEEKGLLGSQYFAKYPTFGEADIVSNVNLDMPILLQPMTELVAFGAERSSLGPIVSEAAASLNLKLIPDPVPTQSLFTRSDHYSFVREGVPSVFLFVGFRSDGTGVFDSFIKEHYHKPSDDLALPIDYDAAAIFADLNAKISRTIAEKPEAPRWNDGDFFGEQFGK